MTLRQNHAQIFGMKMIVLVISLALNIVLLGVWGATFFEKKAGDDVLVKQSQSIVAERTAQSALFEELLKGKLVKSQLVSILMAQKQTFFENSDQNAVGFRNMFFVFDDKGNLTEIKETPIRP